jgi:predicted DCC family thiol-disulfide oxidoreductase YuxK
VQTTPPPKPVILYDGHCRFCTTQMKNLARWLPAGSYEALSFQEPGVLDRFPGVTYDLAMEAMTFIDHEGRVFRGMEGAVRAIALRLAGKLAFGYYVPGVRQLLDAVYRRIAARRYAIAGLVQNCEGGTCALHVPPGKLSA